MKLGSILLSVGILALFLSACGPVVISGPDQSPVQVNALSTAPQSEVAGVSTAEPVTIVTPRGNQLVATDPSLVNLSSGVPTLVEFFRFT
jgi:hypothetical protein